LLASNRKGNYTRKEKGGNSKNAGLADFGDSYTQSGVDIALENLVN
jgi:hypothetical protein